MLPITLSTENAVSIDQQMEIKYRVLLVSLFSALRAAL